MNCIENKKDLQKIIEDILSSKDWPEDAKSYIRNALIFAFDHYIQPPCFGKTKEEYIKSYLDAIRKTNKVHVFQVEDFNTETDGISCFIGAIREIENGEFDIVDGRYIPSKSGNFCCTLGAYTDTVNKNVYFLAESDPIFRNTSVHHELTHIQEGQASFWMPATIPFAKEFRTMCYEGRASLNESFLHQSYSDCTWCDVVKNSKEVFKFYSSESPYSLYELLYTYFVIIFGYDAMEELAKNDDFDANMLTFLKSKFPNIPVYELYAHITYILSCFHTFNPTIIKNIINLYKVDCYRDVTHTKHLCSKKQKELNEIKNSKKVGDKIELGIYRNGKEEKISIVLESDSDVEKSTTN